MGDQKVVLVTGATSGIGKATAELLAAKGYRVFGTSRDPQGKTGNGHELLQLDVTSDESVAACVKAVAERTGGRIDVLHNNAGTGIIGAAEEITPEEGMRLFQINFFGIMRMTNTVLPFMRERKAGTVINMSSSGGVAALPFAALYCATKFALEGYTEAIRHELRPFNVAAVIVAPGPVSTPAGEKAMRAEKHIPEYADRRKKADELSLKGIRGGMDPKKVAETILKVVKADWPSPRYTIGMQSRATNLAHGLLPPSTFEAAVRWGVGLG
ncbi:short-chain dehydrogenase : Short-chain dehydrogenase/reductase SDR OS=Truepera radiovictrix (strain DSM 17093 / CIP 108686 / LMG 22925 / RQ-24) GN=Trad_0976 PE=3 SV=1: adh_short [Gemmata massiliana]|uniref:Ketoreductase domain-containing protein n=1 Tax=Gemmata massiliana TaxID=1210884 RepID=A0A6P2DJQ7_9BACT|nr:SDR family NAD(P)-dependent oxidoreductase [Gemmata massiliana]VTS00533.1 short-chain dehydrogenase : Short-chain dehydrogenase/reductase SDR OS=Truepera radiovictrix (strain DSM 17093 / CIP 108686 / LMG 22925 / RQ-24) GN=Trad_0976 PE=3 SV=1: adh_short [Gemmata massiliana]